MKVDRSGSQILHGFLPQQTVDLNGGVWRVSEWRTPRLVRADTEALRMAIVRATRPWEAANTDGGFVQRLREGRSIRVHGLDRQNGVLVDRFPALWQCRVCHRVRSSNGRRCECGQSSWGQLHFVGYHTCGAIEEPFIPRCQTHNDVRVVFPGSSDARQIRFECPVCRRVLRQGFGFGRCNCGSGALSYNVHRASSVFAPRSVAVVSAPTEELRERLRAVGGAARALAWVVGGMPRGGVDGKGTPDARSLVAQLISSGLSREVAERMTAIASASNEVSTVESIPDLGANESNALDEATSIFNATAESRSTVDDLIDGSRPDTVLGDRYRTEYRRAVERAGFSGVELAESFPILTGYFGYTRGDQEPGASRLMTWRDTRTRSYVVYGELQHTEALFFRLSPLAALGWLRGRGHRLASAATEREARIVILRHAHVPLPGDEVDVPTVGSDLLTLVHSICHRMIRQTAVLAGIDRNSLAELLVPSHLGFFVYAAARGDFVLGGLQALFESDLPRLLDAYAEGEHRCALDPGCTRVGGACVACLHLGEPSCRYFNRFLDRRVLAGSGGYLRAVSDQLR